MDLSGGCPKGNLLSIHEVIMSKNRRSAIIAFRATPEEASRIRQLAANKQLTVSTYVRKQLIWSYDYVIGDDEGYRQLTMALEKYLNSTGSEQQELAEKSLADSAVRRGGNE